ncbi:MAG: J domain-containing protein [Armatimonadetes bacterium]|nr:J domain-containing protein [Armatimonadota bacterium]
MDAKKLVDFEIDYYGVLGLTREGVPADSNPKDRRIAAEILDSAFNASARRCHPDLHRDVPGAEDMFKLVVRAHTILSDPIARRYYDSGGTDQSRSIEIDGKRYEIDWDDLGFYRPGTTADTVGHGLFCKLNERKKELNIVPAFFPELPQHNYEWDFMVPDMGVKLSVSLVPDEEDVRRLTSGSDVGRSLPFKIYVCFPRACPYFFKDDEEVHQVGDRTIVLPGRLKRTMYVDYDLLETTLLDTAHEFVTGDGVANALTKLRDGSLQAEQRQKDQQAGALNWLDTQALKAVETERLREIIRRKTPRQKYDPHAADFLGRIADTQVARQSKDKK